MPEWKSIGMADPANPKIVEPASHVERPQQEPKQVGTITLIDTWRQAD
jgi:hypothetical protein